MLMRWIKRAALAAAAGFVVRKVRGSRSPRSLGWGR